MLYPDKFRLHTPGPTPVPPRVQQAMSQPMIGHRSEQCSALIRSCSERLRPVFGTKQEVLIIAGSGTSALESAVVNSVQAGDEVSVIVTGAFGERFAKIAEKVGCVVHRLNIPWGEPCDPETLKNHLQQHPAVKAVFLTHCETSTGVLNPVQTLAQVVRQQTDALIIVDTVSSLGAVPMEMDEWGIDIVVSGSQKAFMLPPGLAFVAVSDKAWEKIEANDTTSFYLDLTAYRKSLAKDTTPYTPAVSLLFGLNEVLNMLEEQGLEHVYARHELMKDMTRTAVRALGLTLMTDDNAASPTVTSIYGTESIQADTLRKKLAQLNVVLAGGQQHLKGKIFRIGHMGYCEPADIVAVIGSLEIALHQMNAQISIGDGVKAALEVWSRA